MEENRELYAEILGVLLALGNEYVNKLPRKLLDFIKQNCDCSKIPEIDSNIRIEEQNISNDTKVFLTILKLKYWCESEEEKQEVYRLINKNEEEFQKELKEKYDIDNIFKERKEKIKNTTEENTNISKKQNNQLVVVEKEEWYIRFFKKIKSLFKR